MVDSHWAKANLKSDLTMKCVSDRHKKFDCFPIPDGIRQHQGNRKGVDKYDTTKREVMFCFSRFRSVCIDPKRSFIFSTRPSRIGIDFVGFTS